MELQLTIVALVIETALIAYCSIVLRRPANPIRPRLLPYRPIMMVTIVLLLGTLAHLVSLMTGTPVLPRNKFVR